MKKIIALVLVIVSVFTLGACNKNKGSELSLADIQANSDATRVVINTEMVYDGNKYLGESILVKGTYEGKRAMKYVETYQDMAELNDETENAKESTQNTYEYLEGKGVRANGGNWDPTRTDFAYDATVIDLNLAADYLTNVTEDGNKTTAVIAAASVASVFGEGSGITSDVSITVVTNGVKILTITLSYTVASNVQVTLSAAYSYAVELVDIA